MTTLGERIKHIRDGILKVNQADLAGMLGFSRIATISDYEKNKRNPDISTICKIANIGSVSLDWLLTGEGDVFTPGSPKPLAKEESGKALYCEECRTIEVYGMTWPTGAKEFPAKCEPVDAICISAKDVKEGIIAIKIKGESMSPNILDGAVVGIDTKDRHLVSGKLYAVFLNYEGVTIKRVFVCPDRIVLKPDNPSFPETDIPAANIGEDLVVGRLKWVYQRY